MAPEQTRGAVLSPGPPVSFVISQYSVKGAGQSRPPTLEMRRLGEVYKAGSDLAWVPWQPGVVSCVSLRPRLSEPWVPRPTSK